MRTVIIIESAEELIKFARRVRMADNDDTPSLPLEAQIVFDNDYNTVLLQNCKGFQLSDTVRVPGIIDALTKHAGLKCHIT
jgi:hypothetical protein